MRIFRPWNSKFGGCCITLIVIAATLHTASAQRPERGQPIQLSFSPDGEWLIAAYYRMPFNRPGTDWAAWTVLWNTKTWEAVPLPDATMPIAFSADGKRLAMGQYDRTPRGNFPPTNLALWKPGETKPARLLDTLVKESDAKPVRLPPVPCVAAFDPAGEHLAWVDSGGSVWLSAVEDEKQKTVRLDDLKLSLPQVGWGYRPTQAVLSFGKDDRLTLELTYRDAPAKGAPKFIAWKVDVAQGKAERVEEKAFEKNTPLAEKPADPATLKAVSKDAKLTAVANGMDVEIFESGNETAVRKLSGELPKK